jgi:hypothetical protein
MLEESLKMIAVSMANCEFYASIFAGALNRQFTSPETLTAWEKRLETALPDFYASILVFSIKIKGNFTSSRTSKIISSAVTRPLKLIGILHSTDDEFSEAIPHKFSNILGSSRG